MEVHKKEVAGKASVGERFGGAGRYYTARDWDCLIWRFFV